MIALREKLRPGALRRSGGARLGLAAAVLAAVSAGSLFIGVSDVGIADLLRGEPSRMLLFVESKICGYMGLPKGMDIMMSRVH